MRYALVLLAGLIAWTAPAFAESSGNCEHGVSLVWGCGQAVAPQLAPQPTQRVLSAQDRRFIHKGETQAEFEARERRCLATAIYFEARDGPVRRQIGVGQVILNRVRSPHFPETICGVVYQGQMAPGCEFPFACDGRPDIVQPGAQWDLAQSLARKIVSGQVWLSELGYATLLETALAIGTSAGTNWPDCFSSSDLDRRVAACTAFIAETKKSSLDLGLAYKNRGEAYDKKGLHDLAVADYKKAASLGADEKWVVVIRPSPQPPRAEAAVPTPAPPKTETVVATGTGFIINDRGDVVTNNHVVNSCSLIKFGLNGQGLVQGRLVASDGTNDLAVIDFPLPRTKVVASFSNTIRSRPGDDLVVFGFPLVGLLSTSGNLTRGSLTAMSGMQDDVRYMQISAPVQPGNSGGPVLGLGGEVIGVVTSKLNALETMKVAGGDIPQNVNFALKASILRLFLDSHSIPYTVSDHSVTLDPADVGDLSEQFTGIVVCAK
jgi:S1-C subfamily serine protease